MKVSIGEHSIILCIDETGDKKGTVTDYVAKQYNRARTYEQKLPTDNQSNTSDIFGKRPIRYYQRAQSSDANDWANRVIGTGVDI